MHYPSVMLYKIASNSLPSQTETVRILTQASFFYQSFTGLFQPEHTA